jgi:hypothetical protein
MDLDSDGDGCSDAKEAGATTEVQLLIFNLVML